MVSKNIAGGFADAPPAPLASPRHLKRFLLIALGISLSMVLQARRSVAVPAAISKLPLYGGLILVEVVLAWFITIGIRARGHKIADLVNLRGRSPARLAIDAALAVGTFALLRVSGPFLYEWLGRWSSNARFILPATFAESAAWILVSITAGFCEELVYRGYLQRQLWSLTANLPAAVVLQSLIFGLGHIYQGWKPALVTAIFGLIFGAVAAWRRSLVPGMLAHAAQDIVAGLRL
jgi:hypothetical protein